MVTIDLTNNNKSDIKWKRFSFNDGEVHIKFEDELPRKEEYKVICRIKSSDDLFVLMQVGDILDRHEITYTLYIKYLMGMRMDRVMTFNEAFSLKVVANMLNTLNYEHVYIFEPHSDRTLKLIRNSEDLNMLFNGDTTYPILLNKWNDVGTVICYPDKGAYKRYGVTDKFGNSKNTIVLGKTRSVETGEITGMEIVQRNIIHKFNRIVIIDDLCDGGRTFIEANKLLKKEYPDVSIDLFVKHMVNPIGLLNATNTFDHVYITDSYDDYNNEVYNNLTVLRTL